MPYFRPASICLTIGILTVNQVHPNETFVVDLLPDLIRNYEAWEQLQYVPEVGLFWQNGHDYGTDQHCQWSDRD